jgi:hypothetical protein
MNRWWGYLHTDGTVHAKRYIFALDLEEAEESDFVDRVMQPFDAESSMDAVNKLREFFGLLKIRTAMRESIESNDRDPAGTTGPGENAGE